MMVIRKWTIVLVLLGGGLSLSAQEASDEQELQPIKVLRQGINKDVFPKSALQENQSNSADTEGGRASSNETVAY